MTPSRRIAWLFAIVTPILLAVRLGFVADQLQTGGETLSRLAHDGVCYWFGAEYVPIGQRPPEQQAKYWLSEADRVLGNQPTGELARGAAWWLDGPSDALYVRSWQAKSLAAVGENILYVRTPRSFGPFEELAGSRAAELAAEIARSTPDDENSARALAPLLFSTDFEFAGIKPRRPDWQVLLAEAKQHDPDNGLYDYLTAFCLLSDHKRAARSGTERAGDKPDATWPADALAALERAQAKPIVRVGEPDLQAAVSFLRHTQAPRSEWPQLLSNRSRDLMRYDPLIALASSSLSSDKLPSRDALRQWRQILRLLEQIQSDSAPVDFPKRQDWNDILRLAAGQAPKLFVDNPQVFTEAEKAEIHNLLRQCVFQNKLCTTAEADLVTVNPGFIQKQSFWDLVTMVCISWSPQVIVLLIAVAIGAWLIARLMNLRDGTNGAASNSMSPPEPPATAVTSHTSTPRSRCMVCVLAWTVAFAVSFVILGIAPAQVISRESQDAALGILLPLVPATLASWLFAYIWMHRRRVGNMMVILSAVPLAGILFVQLTTPYMRLINDGIEQHVPSLVPRVEIPYLLHDTIEDFRYFSSEWGFVQWATYPGPVVTACGALLLLAIFAWFASRRVIVPGQPPKLAERVRAVAGELTQSAAWSAYALLLCFLWAAPAALRQVEQTFESQWRELDIDRQNAASLAARMEFVRTDPKRISEIRDAVEAELAGLAK